MATQAQKNAARRLHELNDGSEITATYGEGGYTIAHTDPYELSAIKLVGGVLSVPVTVDTVTVIGESNPTEAQMDSGYQYTAEVTFFNAVGGEDDTVTWSINNLGANTSTYSIGETTGLAGATGSATEGDTFDIVATSNFDGTTIGTLNILVES